MNRSLEFHFQSEWVWVLLITVPLLWVCLFSLERRRVKTGSRDRFLEPIDSRSAFSILLMLSIVSTIAGLCTSAWSLLAPPKNPLEEPTAGLIVGLSLLGLAVLLATVALWRKRRHRPVFLVSSVQVLGQLGAGKVSWTRFLPPLFRFLAILAVLLAVARPQIASTEADVFAEGMDIVLTMDVSTSMEAVDFAPPSHPREQKSRIEGEKEVIARFIRQRSQDRLGLVVFASQAFTQCPLTLDYSVLQNILSSIVTANKANITDGTAIGDAIAVAINRLINPQEKQNERNKVKSKVIILLTDGDDNASKLAPSQAAEIAAKEKIKVFTILVGKGGLVPYPVTDNAGRVMGYRKFEIRTNPDLLREIAKKANGKFYRAEDQEALEKDFQDILDSMEKSRIEEAGKFTRNTEVFQLPLLAALLLIVLELAASWTRFRKFP